jgi:hypothetical protein
VCTIAKDFILFFCTTKASPPLLFISTTSISKSLTVVLNNYIENGLGLCKVIENSSITVASSRISESYSSTITHLETKAVIQFKGNSEVLLPNFPYCPERPTWWDCMQTSFTEFTSDLAGVIAIGLYPEVIIGIMSANC